MEGAVKKTKFVWSIILFIVSFVPILFAISFIIKPPLGTQYIKSMADVSFVITATFVVGFGLMCGAHFLYRSYSKARGTKSAGGKIYYWLTFILSVPIFILGCVILLGKLIFNKLQNIPWDSSSSSSDSEENKKYVIKVDGYSRDIEWDKHTRTYRDTSGNHYVTKDGGKTFSKKN